MQRSIWDFFLLLRYDLIIHICGTIHQFHCKYLQCLQKITFSIEFCANVKNVKQSVNIEAKKKSFTQFYLHVKMNFITFSFRRKSHSQFYSHEKKALSFFLSTGFSFTPTKFFFYLPNKQKHFQ